MGFADELSMVERALEKDNSEDESFPPTAKQHNSWGRMGDGANLPGSSVCARSPIRRLGRRGYTVREELAEYSSVEIDSDTDSDSDPRMKKTEQERRADAWKAAPLTLRVRIGTMIRAAIVVTLLVLGTAAAAQALCAGDLDGDCEVRVDEVVTCVGSALEADALISLACDLDHDGSVSIAEMISGVRNALFGCAEKTSGPPPGAQVLFRLAEGSSVTLPDGSEVAIDGSFLVSRCFSPNTFFAGRIETLRFIGHSVVVQGGCSAIGEIVASTLYGGDTPTSFSSQVLVNDESSVLSGQGPYGSFTRLDLTLTAGEYSFRVIAEPDEYRNTEAGEPLCYDWGFV